MTKKDQPYTSKLRGVAALLGEPPAAAAQFVAISSIRLPQQQPRRYFDPEKLEQLTISVKKLGILEPLLVRILHLGEYELVAGERRYRAAQKAGLSEIPVVVRELTDEEALQLSLIENLQREDLNPVEETEAILQLLATQLSSSVEEARTLLYRMQNEVKGKVTQNVLGSQEGELVKIMFNSLGLMSWESFVSSRLPLLNLADEVIDALRQGRIEYTKAQAIARLKDAQARQALLNEAIEENLSLKEILERIRAQRKPQEKPQSLKNLFKETSNRLQKAKFWDNPEKQQALEKLLKQMEALLEEK
ncbi:MAG: ParB/RepB/Spo0J family partition protein [Symplocastrum torsivum CPER-KK1]|uniref:ParB/RepB/Spo0J family partition protein n=1 Tax=Symplocastrum torsivum CPER-KK1 TaxID=450513 RepID=A0A951UCD3_9CYAN|nr:ParB/RepB/Spo0J family partition protein [Symplocastrum torsivum CPER-KK1]